MLLAYLSCCIYPNTRSSLTLYYLNMADPALRYYRLVLVLRHDLLQPSQQEDADLESGVGPERLRRPRSKEPDANEEEEVMQADDGAEATTLNTIGVCLARTRDRARTAQALSIALCVNMCDSHLGRLG